MRSALCPSPNNPSGDSFGGVKSLSAERRASLSDPTSSAQPASTISTHQLLSMGMMQGLRAKYASRVTPPESVTTERQETSIDRKSKYPSGSTKRSDFDGVQLHCRRRSRTRG